MINLNVSADQEIMQSYLECCLLVNRSSLKTIDLNNNRVPPSPQVKHVISLLPDWSHCAIVPNHQYANANGICYLMIDNGLSNMMFCLEGFLVHLLK